MARILLVLTLLFALGACGDDDDTTGAVESDEDGVELDDPAGADDDLIDSVEAYARTQISGDPDELAEARSQGCAEVETDLDATPQEGAGDEPTVSDVEAEVDGDEATVSYRLDPGGEQVEGERWVREDGEWKWDNC